jgi:hypothetical protein
VKAPGTSFTLASPTTLAVDRWHNARPGTATTYAFFYDDVIIGLPVMCAFPAGADVFVVNMHPHFFAAVVDIVKITGMAAFFRHPSSLVVKKGLKLGSSFFCCFHNSKP